MITLNLTTSKPSFAMYTFSCCPVGGHTSLKWLFMTFYLLCICCLLTEGHILLSKHREFFLYLPSHYPFLWHLIQFHFRTRNLYLNLLVPLPNYLHPHIWLDLELTVWPGFWVKHWWIAPRPSKEPAHQGFLVRMNALYLYKQPWQLWGCHRFHKAHEWGKRGEPVSWRSNR